ncbi:MAG TPA: hypothetical protein VEU96_13990 [Bryobacteraceae bacterium]|nr:hypothetical protein [Bryobacteraceae bacterium]
MLVVVQVALALVLLVGSGLMIRTFQALRRVDAGFDPQDVLTLRIFIPASQVKDATALVQLEQAMLEKMRAVPGAKFELAKDSEVCAGAESSFEFGQSSDLVAQEMLAERLGVEGAWEGALLLRILQCLQSSQPVKRAADGDHQSIS